MSEKNTNKIIFAIFKRLEQPLDNDLATKPTQQHSYFDNY